MHALIIEDHYLIVSLVQDLLRDLGYTSFAVENTEEDAIRSAQAQCPDIITADDRLIEGSGVVAVQKICESKPIPVVFIVGDPANLLRQHPGATVVEKPFRVNELSVAVGHALVQVHGPKAAS